MQKVTSVISWFSIESENSKFRRFLSYVRETLWPMRGKNENLKFILLFAMMCSSIFCYTILRILKDTYIISAPLTTANSISFVKTYFVLPCSVFYMIFFCYLTNRISKEYVFFFSVLPLIIFFTLFYLIIFPNVAYFHMSVEKVHYYQTLYPSLRNGIPVIAYWTFSLFYVFAELVGTVVITFLFWSFTNYCYSFESEATRNRFYPLFSMYSYSSFMLGAIVEKSVCKAASKFPKGSKEYFDILFINFYLIVGSLVLFLVLYYLINNYVLNDQSSTFYKNFQIRTKQKMSFSESMKLILTSKYLMSVVLVIVCYGISSNLMEVTWKELVRKELNGVQSDIGAYFSNFYFMVGIATTIFGFLNKFMLSKLGWVYSTSLVPLLLFFSSFVFFFLIVFGVYIPSWLLFGYTSSYLAMQIGFYQDNLTKGGRYGILDPNIQMVYLPLDEELQTKGKASVDIIGSRVGKSIGSFMESTLSVIFKGADQIALAPIFMPVVLFSCGVWFFAVLYLGSAYSSLLKQKELERQSQKNTSA